MESSAKDVRSRGLQDLNVAENETPINSNTAENVPKFRCIHKKDLTVALLAPSESFSVCSFFVFIV